MSKKFKNLQEKAENRGDKVGNIVPANWISIRGNFSPIELRYLASEVEKNYKKIDANKD